MEKALERYLRYHKSAGHSPKTVEHHDNTIRLFIQWSTKHGYSTNIEDLDANVVRQWLDEQRERGLSDSTLATRTRSLKAFANWLTEEEWLPKNPLAKLKIPKESDKPKDTLSPEEVDKLLATCERKTLNGARDYAIMMLLYSTGIRANELVQLQTADVDYRRGLITIRKGKGGKLRMVPLGQKAERALTRYLNHPKRPDQDGGPLFLTDDGRPITFMALKLVLRRRGNKAGIQANPHKWRHSFAIEYIRSGGRVETLKTMLGHSTLDMSLHYARLAGVDIVEAHEAADPTKKLKSK